MHFIDFDVLETIKNKSGLRSSYSFVVTDIY